MIDTWTEMSEQIIMIIEEIPIEMIEIEMNTEMEKIEEMKAKIDLADLKD